MLKLKNLIAVVPVVTLVMACSSSTTPSNPSDAGSGGDGTVADSGADSGPAASCSPAGGPVTGAQDMHCTVDGSVSSQATSQAACHPDAGPPMDAGMDDGGTPPNPYGDTMNNSEGDDDDCKYHVKFTASPICQGANVTFTVTAQNKGAGTPLTGAAPRAEVYLNDTHPAPNTNQVATETSPGSGVYNVGPIKFDAAGKWTVRFHFHEECADLLPESPHGHAAFFVNVP